MSILDNKRTLIVCQLLLSTLALGFFQFGRGDAGKLLPNTVLASLLSTWNNFPTCSPKKYYDYRNS